MPTQALREKADTYVAKEMISAEMANRVLQAIEQERNHSAILNDEEHAANGEAQVESPQLSTRMSKQQMKDSLTKREAMMAEGDGLTDQIWVYKHIIGCIERGELLRLMVQASAGTGHRHHHRRHHHRRHHRHLPLRRHTTALPPARASYSRPYTSGVS